MEDTAIDTEDAASHIEDATTSLMLSLKNLAMSTKAPLNTLSNLSQLPMKNGEVILICVQES